MISAGVDVHFLTKQRFSLRKIWHILFSGALFNALKYTARGVLTIYCTLFTKCFWKYGNTYRLCGCV